MSPTFLSNEEQKSFIADLKKRFEKHTNRHPNHSWNEVEEKLLSHVKQLKALFEMELTGGEPDLVDLSNNSNDFIFVDCSAESPKNRRSLCYDRAALDSRKENKPANSVIDMAFEMGISVLDELDYRKLQTFGKFDQKTSSWIETPDRIRKLDGALFCDFRYDTVFTYHNGASSYYAARGFRGKIEF